MPSTASPPRSVVAQLAESEGTPRNRAARPRNPHDGRLTRMLEERESFCRTAGCRRPVRPWTRGLPSRRRSRTSRVVHARPGRVHGLKDRGVTTRAKISSSPSSCRRGSRFPRRQAPRRLDRRLGVREKRRPEADRELRAEERVQEGLDGALEVGQGDARSDDQRFDLMEHRRVRDVAVASIDLAGADDAHVRRVRVVQHVADLRRGRVRAQEQPARPLDVEGVCMSRAGWSGGMLRASKLW